MIHHERDVREEQKSMYVARTSNKRVIPMEWSWWVTSNNAFEPGEQLIVLANGDDESDLVGWSLLLLAATVRSFAHLPLGTSATLPLEHQMKCKNTRLSGKTLGVALVAWLWEQTLITASALGHREGWTFEPARCVWLCVCVGRFLMTSFFHGTWTKLEQIHTDQWHHHT